MPLRDFLLIMAICVVWASNNIINKIVVAHFGVPPFAYAALRFAVVAIAMAPWLFPAPRPFWRMIAVALLMGGLNFSLMFIGFKTASPSAAAVVLQLGVPMTILISMLFLREEVRWPRALGIAITLMGALIVIWNPAGFSLSTGLLFVAASCFTYAIGAVMLKTMPDLKPLQLQAWVGFASVWPLVPLSLFLEQGQVESIQAHFWPFAAAVLYSALVVSVVAHTIFYSLIKRYDASLLQPITLMTPLLTILGGILVTHDHFDLRMAFGAAITLVGVLVIVLRFSHVMRLFALIRRDPA